MSTPKWVCSEQDKACGTACCICCTQIKPGQEVVYLFSKKAFRHEGCLSPKKEEQILTEDEIRKSQFSGGGSVRSGIGIGDWREDTSPSQENAIRSLEGD